MFEALYRLTPQGYQSTGLRSRQEREIVKLKKPLNAVGDNNAGDSSWDQLSNFLFLKFGSPENNKSGSGKNTYINVHHQHIKPHERLTFLGSQNRSRTLAGLQIEKKTSELAIKHPIGLYVHITKKQPKRETATNEEARSVRDTRVHDGPDAADYMERINISDVHEGHTCYQRS
ncbi:hypothetical protein YC2023_077508 [Brassica napus]